MSEPTSEQADPAAKDTLEAEILGGDPYLTSLDIAAHTGLDVEQTRRLWRALGFPYVDDTNQAFIDADLDAVRLVRDAIDSGIIDFDAVVRLTRALGSTISRLTDWQVSTLLDELTDDSGTDDALETLRSTLDMAGRVGPAFEKLLIYAWRRHLAAAIVRAQPAPTGSAESNTVATVGFADLVSFTQLSNGLDDKRLAALVERFESECTDLITAGGGRTVKTLGDAVLFIVEDPSTGAELALRAVEQIGRSKDIPDLRVGLATGSVITRLGDVFGPPVNLASRLTTVARRNRVIVDHATAQQLSDAFETRVLPPRPMHGFGSVEPVTVRRRWSYRGA